MKALLFIVITLILLGSFSAWLWATADVVFLDGPFGGWGCYVHPNTPPMYYPTWTYIQCEDPGQPCDCSGY